MDILFSRFTRKIWKLIPSPREAGGAKPLPECYEYRIINQRGDEETGEIKAQSLRAALRVLEKKSQRVLSIDKVSRASTFYPLRLTQEELMVFFRELSVICASGLSLQRALQILMEQSGEDDMQAVSASLRKSLEKGNLLSHALQLHPQAFSPFYISMVKSGEASGRFDVTLAYIANLLEREISLKKKVQASLHYPFILFTAGVAGSLIVFRFIFPYLKILVEGLGAKLPFYTLMMINLADSLGSFYIFIPLMFFAVVAGFMVVSFFRKTIYGRYLWEKIMFSIPVFKDVKKKSLLTHSVLILSSLVQSGVKVTAALEYAADISDSLIIGNAIRDIVRKVQEGETIGDSMKAYSSLFPQALVAMVTVGEESGKLSEILDKIVTLYEVELESTLTSFTRLIEPLAVGVLGILAGGAILALFVPIYIAINGL
ncbi:MAG: type II secretion system F family protein [Candidatus Xenobiia bacterium LiM19]